MSQFNLGARGHDITAADTPEALAKILKANNIENIQLALGMSFPKMPSQAKNLSPGMGTYFKNIFAKEGIQIAILSCYINMIHPDLKIREEALQKFISYVKYARYFGASMVASETGGVLEKIIFTEKNYTPEAFAKVVDSVKQLVAAGEKYGVMIAIEPGLNHPLYSLEKVQQLITEVNSDYLGIILDPVNLLNAQTYQQEVELVQSAFEMFGEKIVAVHLKDFTIENEKLIPTNFGDGLTKNKEILEIIDQYKPHLNIILEETKDEALGKAKEKIDQFYL
ncbi:sugar phosphate isomerase/epimerase family protein [Enterococcus timonensis]|uniref:sugar phosphate isomerase/epimerase family protein n=1 Tax=Enterococcus timonensis TaxID=1852364 RepID=UPI0008DAD7F7|nr:sugar phosphate isomerase/epimerase family protein [Enterococcus timonensis]